MVKKIGNIGEELVSHSKKADTSRRGLADELFPYIWIASKQMSTRAISRWLEEKQNIKLSAATIAKVIRESEERMRALVLDMLEKEHDFFCSLPMSHIPTGSTTLFDEDAFEALAVSRNNQGTAMISNETLGGGYARLLGLYNTLKEEWFALPEEFRNECKKYIIKKDLKGPTTAKDFIIENKTEQQKGEDEE